MTFLGPEYRITIRDKTGQNTEYIKDFVSLTVDALWCDKGSYRLTMSGFDDRLNKFVEDNQIIVSMIDPSVGIDTWVDVFSGFIRTPVSSLSEGGQQTFQSFGPSLDELLAKETILWYSGSPQATKIGNVSPIMAEYVTENIGTGALYANGRDADGVVPGVSVVSSGVGPLWYGSKSRKPLLNTLQELRAYAIEQDDQIDFRVIDTGNYTWQFQSGVLGVDRTTRGLDPSTGLNGAGNVPVIFSRGAKNIKSFSRTRPSTNTITQVVALGQGDGINRAVGVALDAAALLISPIARRTRTISVSSTDPDVLQAAAEEELSKLKPRDNFFFQPRDTRSVFNKDYFLGDFITAQDDGDDFHKQVVGAHYSAQLSGDSVVNRTLDFSDI